MSRGYTLLGLLVWGLAACHVKDNTRAIPEPRGGVSPPTVVASTAPPPAKAAAMPTPAPPPVAPARVERLLVPGDLNASVVRPSDSAAPVSVFMGGMCSNANAYLHTFPEAARKQGGVIAIEGDQPCGNAVGFRTYSWDAARQHARVEAALAAAGLTEVPREGITLVGYSQGAALAEQMVQRWPERYSRVVLIGAPTDPSPKSLARARSVVTMACDRDGAAPRMKQAALSAKRAGTPSTYLEMPGCSHGNVTEGERVFQEAFDWLRTNQRAQDPAAPVVRIAGIEP
jgi:predicted esterase